MTYLPELKIALIAAAEQQASHTRGPIRRLAPAPARCLRTTLLGVLLAVVASGAGAVRMGAPLGPEGHIGSSAQRIEPVGPVVPSRR